MTSHRGAWVLRTSVVAAMVAGTLAGVATPAFADHDVRLGSIGNIELRVGGGSQAVTLRVENRGQGNHISENGVANAELTMVVPGGLGVFIESAPGGCTLSANNTRLDCTAQIQPGQTFTGVVQVGVQGNAPVPAGENRNETAQVTLTSHGGNQQFNVRVNGPDQVPSVAEVAGVVVDQNTGQPIEDAKVLLVDSQGQDFERTTNAQGQFQFSGEQIAAGGIALRASKDGYESGGESTHNVGANQSLGDVRLALIDTSTPSPSATPSVTPTATPSPTASPLPAAAPASSGRSFFTTLMIILGVLFVALGIGAIVLLIIRQRRRAQEDEDDDGLDGADDPTSGPHGPGPTPGSRGIYRPTPTQVAGAGAAAHTQVMGPGGTALPAVGPRPALAEAPTMLRRGAVGPADQTAMLPRAGDPPGPRPPAPGAPSVRPASPQATTYGTVATPAGPPAPPGPPPGPYEGQRGTGEYQTQHGGGYGGSPASYGGSPAGYGGDRAYGAYDQPTGRHERPGPGYEPDRSAGYHNDPAGYRNESYGPDPYSQPRSPSGGGYGSDTRPYPPAAPANPEPPSGGYEGYPAHQGYQGSHGDPGYNGGGYEGRGHRGHGYEGGGGYDAAPPEYGRPAEPPPPAADPGYYDDGTPRPRHEPPPGDRRRLDWLD